MKWHNYFKTFSYVKLWFGRGGLFKAVEFELVGSGTNVASQSSLATVAKYIF